MNVCVIDTTVASLMLQNRPELSLYASHLAGMSITISFQTVAEMRYGALRNDWGERRIGELAAFFRSLTIVESSSGLTDCWATIMHEARQAGRRLEAGDAWIAATALLLNVPLLTHDKDFAVDACPSIIVHRYAAL